MPPDERFALLALPCCCCWVVVYADAELGSCNGKESHVRV